jgi:hypothetical protein
LEEIVIMLLLGKVVHVVVLAVVADLLDHDTHGGLIDSHRLLTPRTAARIAELERALAKEKLVSADHKHPPCWPFALELSAMPFF